MWSPGRQSLEAEKLPWDSAGIEGFQNFFELDVRSGISPMSSEIGIKLKLNARRIPRRHPTQRRVVSSSLAWEPGQRANLWTLLYPPSVIELSLGWAVDSQVYAIAACMSFSGKGKEKLSVQLQAATWPSEQLCQCLIELVAIVNNRSPNDQRVKHQPLGNLAIDPLCGELRFQLMVPAYHWLLINMRKVEHCQSSQ